MATEDKKIEILHDHYKESFANIREVEQTRDRLFLWVIGLYALLCFEIGYPAAVGASLGKLEIFGGELSLQSLPLPALLNATWVLTLAIALRYCQATVGVDRKYVYLHYLEEVISPQLGGDDIYRREGKRYLSEYPVLLEMAWRAYAYLFPIIVIVATVALIVWELMWVLYPIAHIFIDAFIAAAIGFFFFCYRLHPYLAPRWKKWRGRSPRGKQVQSPSTPEQDRSQHPS